MADEQFYTILTNAGKAKVANATLLNSNVTLKTLKVGDSNGSYYNPTEEQTVLKNTVYSCDVGSVQIDKDNPNWIIVETVIPGSVGGFTIREIGLFDVEGDLIAVGKYPETYKPVVANGASKDLCIRTIFEVSNTQSVNLSINPSVIIATKEDIDNLQEQIDENRASLEEKANKSELDRYYSLYEATNIVSNTDLNDIKDIGNYLCVNVSIAETLINSPFKNGGFTLKNERCTGGSIKNFIRQTIKTNSSASRTFVRNYVTNESTLEGVWSEWHEIAYKKKEDTVLFEGSVYLNDTIITLNDSIDNYKLLRITLNKNGNEYKEVPAYSSGVALRAFDITAGTSTTITFFEINALVNSETKLQIANNLTLINAGGTYTKKQATSGASADDFLKITKIVGVN